MLRVDQVNPLLISTYFPPDKGGIATLMASIAGSLSGTGVACLTDVRADVHQDRGRPYRVYRRPSLFHGRKYIQAPALIFTMGRILWQQKPKINILASIQEGYLGLWLKRWFKIPYVVYAHGNEILDLVNQAGQVQWKVPLDCLRQADGVIAVSHYTAGLVRELAVSPERIHVVHPGCDTRRFMPSPPNRELRRQILGAAREGPVLMTVGNLVERKGHDMVIRALPQLLQRFTSATYLIAGEGRDRQMLEVLARDCGVADHVVFAGAVPDDLLPDLYSICDLFVMPSRERRQEADVEGFGIVYLEANACGKPVIGGRAGGVPDAVQHGETGLLVDPVDSAAIAEAICSLLSDPEKARRMGLRGRERVLREFDWNVIGTRLRGILEQILREKEWAGQ